MSETDAIEALLRRGASEGCFRGATWRVESRGSLLSAGSAGEASPETPFDLASLTKPLATALLALLLEEEGRLDLSSPARALVPELEGTAYDDVTLLELGCHTSGLPEWRPLYLRNRSLEGFLSAIAAEPPAGPRGASLYSDLGYIVLGAAVERAGRATLDRLFEERVAGPAGVALDFAGPERPFANAAPTEEGNAHERTLAGDAAAGYAWRTEFAPGVVHDENARVLGGVAGHAGLFGTSDEVATIARAILEPGVLPLSAERRERLLGKRDGRLFGTRPAEESETLGGVLPEGSVGHFGFTGTSLWIAPRDGRIFVLLTNRVRPGPGDGILSVRREFHRIAAAIPSA